MHSRDVPPCPAPSPLTQAQETALSFGGQQSPGRSCSNFSSPLSTPRCQPGFPDSTFTYSFLHEPDILTSCLCYYLFLLSVDSSLETTVVVLRTTLGFVDGVAPNWAPGTTWCQGQNLGLQHTEHVLLPFEPFNLAVNSLFWT